MESPIRRIQQQELLVQMGWVKRLAGGLMADEGAADDIAQTAWLVALEKPPRTATSGSSFRAFLSSVTRKLAIDRARSERNRRERERRAARRESTGSAFEIVERNAIHNRISEAVMRLQEPYRSTVLYRYFDEMSVAEVADRMAVSEPTVRKRLSRGLAELRVRLESEFGGGRSWVRSLLVLLGRQDVALPTRASGAFAWLAVAYVLAVSGLAVALLLGRSEVSQPPAMPALAGEVIAHVPPEPPPGYARARRDAVPERAEPRADTAGALVPLYGRTLDLTGEPRGGLSVQFLTDEPNSAPGARMHCESGDAGDFELLVPDVRGRVRAESAAFVGVLDAVVVGGVADSELIVVVAPLEPLSGRVTDVHGAPIPAVKVELSLGEAFRRDFDLALAPTSPVSFGVLTGPDGSFELDAAPYLPAGLLKFTCVGYRLLRREAGAGYGPGQVYVLQPIAANPNAVAGRVLQSDGSPATRARVFWHDTTVRTDALGRFQIDRSGYPPVPEIVAAQAGALPARAWLDPQAGVVEGLVLQLGGPPPYVEGIVVTDSGEPVGDAAVWIEAGARAVFAGRVSFEHELFLRSTLEDRLREDPDVALRTDAAGRFRLPLLPGQHYSLAALDRSTLAFGRSELVRAGRTGLVIRLGGGTARRVSGVVTDLDGRPLERVRVYPGVPDRTLCGRTANVREWGAECTTNARGEFEFPALVAGELVLRCWKGAGYVLTLRELAPDDARTDLLIQLPRRHQIRVCLPLGLEADTFRVFDRAGESLWLDRIYGELMRHERTPGFDFGQRSDVFGVSEEAAFLGLYRGGEQVRTWPLRFEHDRVLRVRVE